MSQEAPSSTTTSPQNAGAKDAPSGKPQPHSDQRQLTKKGKPVQKRDTHFVCFPLVTDGSVPQLAASLEHFRSVTTLTPEIAKRRRLLQRQETPEKESHDDEDHEEAADGRDNDGEAEGAGRNSIVKDKDLKILPPAAHRPPRTFHLTIGTMDLSDKNEMDRAVRVLKDLDLQTMLRDVEREVGLSGQVPLTKKSEESRQEHKAEEMAETESATDIIGKAAEEAVETVKDTVSSLTRSISPPPRSRSPPNSSPIVISLEGLSAFQSPRKARVFYAPPHDPSNRLLLLANKIRNVFKAEGFVTEKRELTLHATVANMSYANKSKKGGRGGKGVRSRDVVDGRGLVEVFGGREDVYRERAEGREDKRGKRRSETHNEREGGYIWAKDIVVDRVRICKMGAEKSDDSVLVMVYPAVRTERGEVAEVDLR